MLKNLNMNSLRNLNTGLLTHFCGAAIILALLVSWLQMKSYGVIFLLAFVLCAYKNCSASIKIILPPELEEKFVTSYDKLLKLRKDRPPVFCGLVSISLAFLAIVGHLISGSTVVIIGLILAGLVSTRYNFKILREPNKDKLSWAEFVADSNDVDDFLPEVNDTNLFVLQRASDQAILTAPAVSTVTSITSSNDYDDDDDRKSDEIPSELLLPDSIPEVDENSEASSEDELIPKLPSDEIIKQQQQQHQSELEFKKGYFKKDSSISTSSSDDESLSKGLNFNDYSLVDGGDQQQNSMKVVQPSVSSTATAASVLLPHLLAGMMPSFTSKKPQDSTIKSSTSQQQKRLSKQDDDLMMDTSDESDFEFLNTDDLNKP